jgi:hypothetical protein
MPVTKNHSQCSSVIRALPARLPATLLAIFAVMLVSAGAAQAKLSAPALQSPRNSSTVQSLPAFTWKGVRNAASYQFEFSATRNFSAGVNGWSAGPIPLSTTAITNDATIPNGTYYWRARAMSKTDVPGSWSKMRKLNEDWTASPTLSSPVNSATVNWPTTPLTLNWKTVSGAVNYDIEIGTSPSMSDLVSGPTEVQGPDYVIPNELAPDTYYWTIQPVNAAGQPGVKSKVASFTLAWPSNTTLTESNGSPDSTYEEPTFSWTPIAGAASYELQVSTNPAYPANAIILDSTNLISTTYHPSSFFPNHTTLYWRMRARDLDGDAGAWNDGQGFTETFDQSSPTIQNLHVVDPTGNVIDGQETSDPIIRWSPVPGASSYTVTFAIWVSDGSGGGYCDYNDGAKTTTTPETAMTPIGTGENSSWESNEYGWPGAANNGGGGIFYTVNAGTTVPTCVSVIALRNDNPLAGSTIESAPTVLGGSTGPAFTYLAPTPTSGALGSVSPSTYAPGIVPPAYGSGAVSSSSVLATTPLFEWQPVANAAGYYVIIANDSEFDPNSIVAGVYTDQTSWVPPVSLNDQSAAYWWEVIPVSDPSAQPEDNAEGGYAPQPFNKSSVPPNPISPLNGANVGTQPTFSWSSAAGAVNYTLQISADPSFANPIESDQTDSTSFTSGSTLPPGETLYWRVRANDVSNALNWSSVQTFTHNLPAPALLSTNPTSGSTIPTLAWTAISSASSYNLQITSSSGASTTSVDTPYLTPQELLAPGISTLKVQAVYPGGATSAYSNATTYDRKIPAPSGIRATKIGSRILVTWKSDSIAKAYLIQLSTTPGFSSPVASDTTQNLAWVPQIPATDVNVKLYWRLAVVDFGGSTGAFHQGVFKGKSAKKSKPLHKHKKKKKKK